MGNCILMATKGATWGYEKEKYGGNKRGNCIPMATKWGNVMVNKGVAIWGTIFQLQGGQRVGTKKENMGLTKGVCYMGNCILIATKGGKYGDKKGENMRAMREDKWR